MSQLPSFFFKAHFLPVKDVSVPCVKITAACLSARLFIGQHSEVDRVVTVESHSYRFKQCCEEGLSGTVMGGTVHKALDYSGSVT